MANHINYTRVPWAQNDQLNRPNKSVLKSSFADVVKNGVPPTSNGKTIPDHDYCIESTIKLNDDGLVDNTKVPLTQKSEINGHSKVVLTRSYADVVKNAIPPGPFHGSANLPLSSSFDINQIPSAPAPASPGAQNRSADLQCVHRINSDHIYAKKPSHEINKPDKIPSSTCISTLEIANLSNLNPSGFTQINGIHYNIYKVPGGGDCFFHSLSLLINGNLSMTSVYREYICSFIIQNWPAWEDKIQLFHDHNMSLERYKRYMLLLKGWATSAEIEAASILLKLKINIWLTQQHSIIKNVVNSNNNTTEIDILLSASHFQPLKMSSQIFSDLDLHFSHEIVATSIFKAKTKRKSNSAPQEKNNKRAKTKRKHNSPPQDKENKKLKTSSIGEAKKNTFFGKKDLDSKTTSVKNTTLPPEQNEPIYTAEIYVEPSTCNPENTLEVPADHISIQQKTPATNSHITNFSDLPYSKLYDPIFSELYMRCRKVGLSESGTNLKNIKQRLQTRIKQQLLSLEENYIPYAPPLHVAKIQDNLPFSYADAVKHNLNSDHIYAQKLSNKTKATKNCCSVGQNKSHEITKADKIPSPTLKLANLSNLNPSGLTQIHGTQYNIYKVPGGGDCFFHSLSLLLNGNLSMTSVYREYICSFIIQNWPAWEDKIQLFHDINMSLEGYKRYMLFLKGWATSAEIEAASILLKLKINIWLAQQNSFTKNVVDSNNNTTEVDILLSASHFQPLKMSSQIFSDLDLHFSPNIAATSISTAKSKRTGNSSPQEKKNKKLKTSSIGKAKKNTLLGKTDLDSKTTSAKETTLSPEQSEPIYTAEIYVEPSTCNAENTLEVPAEHISIQQKTQQTNSNTIDFPDLPYSNNYDPLFSELYMRCRKLGVTYDFPSLSENHVSLKNRKRRLQNRIKQQLLSLNMEEQNIPDAPPLHENCHLNHVLDCIRKFELHQMSLSFNFCTICKERRLDMKISNNVCKRCSSEKSAIKLYSADNNMDPKPVPNELSNLSIVEQQLISRISPCINVHMLNHGGVASSGHCVTFPQEVNEPAQIFPRLPSEINIVKVRRQGKNDTSKDFTVRRYKVQNALVFLKSNNPAYSDIIISQERLDSLPLDGNIDGIETIQYHEHNKHISDKGPAPDQNSIGEISGSTHSSVLLPEPNINIKDKVNNIVKDVIGEQHGPVNVNKKGTVTIPWPTRHDTPISEFTTKYFFTLAFPCLFPYSLGDFYINRPRSLESLSDWAEHLLWYDDGRFAHHQYFKFVIHNMIMRKKALENSNFVVNQKLGDKHLSLCELREKIQSGDNSIAKKILYFSASLRGTSQYWSQRARELRALIQFQINEKQGLPSFFSTGSCAEYHFKPLRRLLCMYIKETCGKDIDLSNPSDLFDALQKNTHIVAQYFDIRTQSYFKNVMSPAFGINVYWYRQEFAKSRGMIHWHGLCWRSDREPHDLMNKAIEEGLSDHECAERLSAWASEQFGMSASHPAGKDENGQPRKNFWPPPEGTAPAPPEEKNPLVKLLLDVSSTQETLLEDYLLLTNRFNLHRCSDYCLTSKSGREKQCRMEFGTEKSPGKQLRETPALVKDKNGSLRLEMARDHPMLVQHSRFHTQGWRANGDVSLIVSKSDPENPSVEEIIAVEKYVSGYACKGNQPTGAVVDLFNDLVNTSDESTGASAKSICTKLLMGTVKRDIPAVEASFELSRLPLYRSSHTFQNVSLTGSRILDKTGSSDLVTKNTALDKYLQRNEKDMSSFYSFICKTGKVPVVCGNVQATWPLDENYCRTMLLLHTPNWRKPTDIKNDNITWVEKMATFLESDECPNFVKADIEKAKRNFDIESIGHEQDVSEDLNELGDQPDWMELLKPNPHYEETGSHFIYDDGGPDCDWSITSHEYPPDLGIKWVQNLQSHINCDDSELELPDVDISLMNKDQRFAFLLVMKALKNYIENSENFEPLRLIVSGTAGSGKSFLIKCLVKVIRLLLSSNKAVQVLCPTGNSANIISGVTLHSFLKVPTRNRGKEMKSPEGLRGESLQENCEGLKVILVDERSLIGSTTLGWMEFMCRCGVNKGKNFDQSWGGLPIVVFFGDDVQLPPVLDSPVYNSTGKTPASMHGILVWREFNHAVNLRTIVRQGNDQNELKEVLLSLREYKSTPEQAKWLQNFQWDNLKKSHGDSLLQCMYERGLFVFPTHEEVWAHNKMKLLDVNRHFPIAKSEAVGHGVHAKSVDSDKAEGLQKILFLCKSAKVMLTINLCVPFGLFNGAVGTIVDIIYKNGRRPENSLPDVVMVEFPNYTGPPFMSDFPKYVPIIPVERQIDCHCNGCRRKQIPLKLGWATTIHKCQGMTIGSGEINSFIVINPGTRSFESRNPGALFVALSRAKSAGTVSNYPDFAWHSSVLINEDRICHRVTSPTVIARSNEVERILRLSIQTNEKFAFLERDNGLSCFITNVLNAEE